MSEPCFPEMWHFESEFPGVLILVDHLIQAAESGKCIIADPPVIIYKGGRVEDVAGWVNKALYRIERLKAFYCFKKIDPNWWCYGDPHIPLAWQYGYDTARALCTLAIWHSEKFPILAN